MTKSQQSPPSRCVFCHGSGKRTDEHVWPQWLRKYPAFQKLLDVEDPNRRLLTKFPQLAVDDDGRFISTPGLEKRWPLLPYVKVRLCKACNEGWMSDLEEVAISIIDPWIGGTALRLDQQQQQSLALWVAKTAMTYSMWFPAEFRVFDESDYEAIYSTRLPPENSLMWVAFSDDPYAQIAMSFTPHYLSFEGQDGVERPTVGSFYLAAHGVVFFYHFWHGPGEAQMLFDLDPNVRPGVQQLWPPRAPVRGPLALISGEQLEAIRSWIGQFVEAAGLPFYGLTEEERMDARARFFAGEDPLATRADYAVNKGRDITGGTPQGV